MCNRINQEPEVPIATTVAQEEGVAAEGFLVSVREPAHEGVIRLGLSKEWRAKKGGWGGEGNGTGVQGLPAICAIQVPIYCQ